MERIKEREGNAYLELKSMIGLNNPKNIIDKIISYYNTRKYIARMELNHH